MPVDTVVKNCKIVRPTGISQEGIAIDKGKIVSVAYDDLLPNASKTLDAQGKYVIPGVVDVHVHYGVYKPFYDEIFEMNAAAYGGTDYFGLLCEFRSLLAKRHLFRGIPQVEGYLGEACSG